MYQSSGEGPREDGARGAWALMSMFREARAWSTAAGQGQVPQSSLLCPPAQRLWPRPLRHKCPDTCSLRGLSQEGEARAGSVPHFLKASSNATPPVINNSQEKEEQRCQQGKKVDSPKVQEPHAVLRAERPNRRAQT